MNEEAIIVAVLDSFHDGQREKKARAICAALNATRSTPVGVHVPEAFAGAPERHPLAGHAALAGPYHADETGTFNNAGWGFSVIVPSEFWGGDPDDFPENIRDAAETLERAIRLHLNAAAPPAPQVEGAGR